MTAKREELKMRITYEPNRFSDNYLSDAYEALAPRTQQRTADIKDEGIIHAESVTECGGAD